MIGRYLEHVAREEARALGIEHAQAENRRPRGDGCPVGHAGRWAPPASSCGTRTAASATSSRRASPARSASPTGRRMPDRGPRLRHRRLPQGRGPRCWYRRGGARAGEDRGRGRGPRGHRAARPRGGGNFLDVAVHAGRPPVAITTAVCTRSPRGRASGHGRGATRAPMAPSGRRSRAWARGRPARGPWTSPGSWRRSRSESASDASGFYSEEEVRADRADGARAHRERPLVLGRDRAAPCS